MIATQAAVERYSAGRKSLEVPHFVLNGAVVKPCNRCGRVKEIEQFGHHRLTWDGRQNACLACTGPEGLEPAAATERQRITSPPPLPQRSPEANRESARRGAALSHAARAKKARPASPIPSAPPGPGRVLADPWTETKGGGR